MSSEIESQSEILFNILKNDRKKLLDFLKNNKYDDLKKLLCTIEEKNKSNINILNDLMLGKIGPQTNKQKAVYSLPTIESLKIIKEILDHYKIKKIEEIGAGLGLLSGLLHNYLSSDEYKIVATDGFRWINTYTPDYYYPVKKKLFLEYCLDNINYDDTLIIINFIPTNEILNLIKFITSKKPKYLLIIDEMWNELTTKKILDKINTTNYNYIDIPAKIISYRDYFMYNKVFPENSCRTSMIFCSTDNMVTTDSLIVKCGPENFSKKINIYTDKMYAQDIIMIGAAPLVGLDILKSDSSENTIEFIKMLGETIKNKIIIPKHIESFEELQFWFKKWKFNKLPLLITDRETFLEYFNYSNIIKLQGGFQKLKNDNILPAWTENGAMAEKILWLEFSTASKNWKESVQAFNNEYSEMTMYRNTRGATRIFRF